MKYVVSYFVAITRNDETVNQIKANDTFLLWIDAYRAGEDWATRYGHNYYIYPLLDEHDNIGDALFSNIAALD